MISFFGADVLANILAQADMQAISPGMLSESSPHIVVFTIALAIHVAPVAGKLLLGYAPAVGLVQVKRLSTVNALVSIFRIG